MTPYRLILHIQSVLLVNYVSAFHVSAPTSLKSASDATDTTIVGIGIGAPGPTTSTQLYAWGRKPKTSEIGDNDKDALLVMKSQPPIAVKPRPLVSLDEKTGLYIPPEKTSSEAPVNYYANDDSSYTSVDVWSSFKDGVYGIIDAVLDLARGNKESTNGISDRKISVAYMDTVGIKSKSKGQTASEKKGSTPGTRLLETYDQSLKNDPETKKDISTGENLYTSNKRKTFDAAKDTLFNTVDAIAKKNDNVKKVSSNEVDLDAFQVATRPSFNNDESVALVSSKLDDLVSNNPLKRFRAKLAISAEQRKRQRSLQMRKKKDAFDSLKEMFFSVVDTFSAMYAMLLAIPQEVQNVIEATQDTMLITQTNIQESIVEIQKTPAKIEQTVDRTITTTTETIDTIKQIPVKVENQLTETKNGITKTIQEVQTIPSKVEQTVVSTKKSIEDTKQGIENFVFDAKVMAGLEEPKPLPPPPPPPPKTGQEIALEVAGEAAKLAGKGAVVVAKGTAGMAISGTKLAWNAATKSAQEKKNKEQAVTQTQKKPKLSISAPKLGDIKANLVPPKFGEIDANLAAAETVISKASMSKVEKPPKTIAEIDPALEKEVAEALRVAEEALAVGKEETEAAAAAVALKSDGVPTLDVNDAVKKAKEAAAQARKDANDLQTMLMQRKFYVKEE